MSEYLTDKLTRKQTWTYKRVWHLKTIKISHIDTYEFDILFLSLNTNPCIHKTSDVFFLICSNWLSCDFYFGCRGNWHLYPITRFYFQFISPKIILCGLKPQLPVCKWSVLIGRPCLAYLYSDIFRKFDTYLP